MNDDFEDLDDVFDCMDLDAIAEAEGAPPHAGLGGARNRAISNAPARAPSVAETTRAEPVPRAILLDVMKALRGECDLTSTERMVLVVIADHGERCWPSVQTIAHASGYRRSAVIVAIAALEAEGWIVVERTHHESNVYRVAAAKVRAAAVAYLETRGPAGRLDRLPPGPADGQGGVQQMDGGSPADGRGESSRWTGGVQQMDPKASYESPTKDPFVDDQKTSPRTRSASRKGRRRSRTRRGHDDPKSGGVS